MIRLTFDLDSDGVIVERGRLEKAVFTRQEQTEFEQLRDQLEPYGDFTAFKDLSQEQIKKVTKLKKRRAELEARSQASKTVWEIVPESEVQSVVLVLRPGYRVIYVENLPGEWIDKLFSQQLILENPQIHISSPGSSQPAAQPAPQDTRAYMQDSTLSAKHNKVIETIYKVDPTYLELLEIKQEGDFIIVHPYDWLGEPWGKINQAFEKQFGESAAWISKGKGDRDAHWEVL